MVGDVAEPTAALSTLPVAAAPSAAPPTAAAPPTPVGDVSLRWSDVGLFVACYVTLVGVWFALGELITHSTAVTSRDRSIAEWFVDQRTPTLDPWSEIASGLADTLVKIVATAVLALLMWLAWRRWREPLMLVVPLLLEASVFITVTYLVGRSRPDVVRLEGSPVGSSFPSGHVAAATVYGALVVVVFWHTRHRWARALVVVVLAVIPVLVGLGRMYRGMHFLTDVIAGVLLGIASIALSWWIIDRAMKRGQATHATAAPSSGT
jgi:membrane-associated phospholipid phosphatase